MMFDRFETGVVGVSFVDGYPENLHSLAQAVNQGRVYTEPDSDMREVADRLSGEYTPVVLVRNPDNPFDANAIEVHVPIVGMVGHVPKRVAAGLAPELDAGEAWLAGVVGIWIHPDHPERPGLSIRLERVA